MGAFREALEDIELPNNGIVIRKGMHCIIPMIPLNRAAVGVIRPDEFEPDRWIDPKQAQPLADSYLPFSAGNRNCVGMALAQAELVCIIAAVVTNFDIECVRDFTPDYFLTLKPAGGLISFKRAL
jgi:cytochrome P450